MITTAWGVAELVEEITVSQGTPEREFAARVQLLTNDEGETLVRFAYSTGGTARRGPVTLRAGDLRRLARSLSRAPRLKSALAVLAM
jgi:hypothetical protein